MRIDMALVDAIVDSVVKVAESALRREVRRAVIQEGFKHGDQRKADSQDEQEAQDKSNRSYLEEGIEHN